MRRIDRYLLGQYVQVFCICFISLTGLYVVIDAFGNLDDFLEYSEKEGSLIEVVTRYYGYRSIAFFDRISGLLALIAAMFTVTWIQRHQEMTALLAAGIPTFRIIAPILLAAGGLSVLAAANRELVLPHLRQALSVNAQDLAGSRSTDVRPRHDHQTEILLRGKQLHAMDQRIEEPNFLLPLELSQYGKDLVAKSAEYREPQDKRPGGYLLQGVTHPTELLKSPSLRLNEQPVVLSPLDTDWLGKDECFVRSDVTFDQLQGGSNWKSYSSTWDLVRGLRNPSLYFRADVAVTVHARMVQPLLDVTLLFLGLPLVLARGNQNVFVAIGLCILLALLFLVVVFACQALGSSGWLGPARAAWLPLFLFVPLAVLMSEPLRN